MRFGLETAGGGGVERICCCVFCSVDFVVDVPFVLVFIHV